MVKYDAWTEERKNFQNEKARESLKAANQIKHIKTVLSALLRTLYLTNSHIANTESIYFSVFLVLSMPAPQDVSI